MAEMRVERKSVLEYLSVKDFVIPMYQRPYTWDKEQCEQLWNDLQEFYENKQEEEEYFLGTSVLHQDKKIQYLIDGQQRTTT